MRLQINEEDEVFASQLTTADIIFLCYAINNKKSWETATNRIYRRIHNF